MSEFNLIKIDGKPLEKLIEVISNGIGTIYRPKSIKKEAEARAYEIEIIERAKAKALAEGKEIDADLYDRIQERLLFKETKRQVNIDNVAKVAAEQLKEEENVSDEPVSENWSTRFFNIVEDVSDKEMQNLLGKILAGEIKQPKSYSLRTLELVRNLSKNEAEIFNKIANFAIEIRKENYLFTGNDDIALSEKFKVSYNDRALLAEIGLLQPGTFVNYHLTQSNANSQKILLAGNIILFVNIKANTSTIEMPVDVFTTAGNELLKLIVKNPPMDYLAYIANSIKNENVDVKYSSILAIEDDKITYTQPLVDFK